MDQMPHWRRSEEIADTTRRYLIAIHTGGIGVCFAVASSLAGDGVAPSWAWLPVGIFSSGLVIVLISLFWAKERALERHKQKASDPSDVKFPWYIRSMTWDVTSTLLFAFGAAAGIYKVSEMVLPAPPS